MQTQSTSAGAGAAGAANQSQEVDIVYERFKAIQASAKSLKSGKSETMIQSVVQEVVSLLSINLGAPELAEAGMVCLNVLLHTIPSLATLVRLQGGMKPILRALRKYSDELKILTPAVKALQRICLASSVAQQSCIKEKGFTEAVLLALVHFGKDEQVVLPLMEVLTTLTRYNKGAKMLCTSSMVAVLKDIMMNFLSNWHVFGSVLKVLKHCTKQDAAHAALIRSQDCVRLLLGVARLLSRIPEQRKVFKRVYRTLWLLSPQALTPLQPLEAAWALPNRDAPHLMLSSAMDPDPSRMRMMFPEDVYGAEGVVFGEINPQLQVSLARPQCPAPCTELPPSAAELTAVAASMTATPEPFHTSGAVLQNDMMMHELRRLMAPELVLNRQVYINTAPPCSGSGTATPTSTSGSSPPVQGGGSAKAALLTYNGIGDSQK